MDGLTVPVVITVLGGVCILAAIFGGMTGNVSLPTLTGRGRLLSGILGAIFLLAGSGMLFWLHSSDEPKSTNGAGTGVTASPTPPPSNSSILPSSPSATSSPLPPKARITYPPHDGDPGAPVAVSHTSGLVVRGTTQPLAGESLWLFDFDPEDGQLYEVSAAPIPVSNGGWSKQDGPIGDEGVKKLQYIALVRADESCNAVLKTFADKAKKDNAEPFSLDKPPTGCVEDDRVPVNITGP